ncbi:MAG: dUTP diphosphatase [Pseudomonadota bacterium]|jgi:dUTP pyrophosphatase
MNSPGRNNGPEVLIKVLPHAVDLAPPVYATDRSAGMDIAAAIMEDVVIEPGHVGLIPAGFMVAVPDGFEAQIRPRSGLALNHGITVPNSPGTIDPDYRGEVKIILLNLGPEPFIITRGMRIAQMVIVPAVQAAVKVVEELPLTQRGEGGFGHSGT